VPEQPEGMQMSSLDVATATVGRGALSGQLGEDGRPVKRPVTFLPEPEPRRRKYLIVSVDDHIVEPPHMFEGRLPTRLADRAPRVVEGEDGAQLWHYDGNIYPNVGFNAVVGRPVEEYSAEPTRFDEMRKGCWDIHERIKDMDINGIWASLNFPSLLPGFAGQKFSLTKDPELGLAVMRAWNDWHLEEWAGPYPQRIIPAQLTWLQDPEVAAEEIRRNAERGFKAVSFTENPEKLGLPSIHTGYWDPFVRACAETGTVICLHVGSSSTTQITSSDAPIDTIPALFPVNSMFAAVDWVFSKIPVRFPDVKIVLSEGGIGWVPGLMDRLDHNMKYHGYTDTWKGIELRPSEILRRNFWFCAIDDPSGFQLRQRTGIDRLLMESDYPHADSTWPDTQDIVESQLGQMPEEDIRKITYENAAELYRHPVPVEELRRSWLTA
jgi:predicted TIM-barrel fold metal-dependent hydrolase